VILQSHRSLMLGETEEEIDVVSKGEVVAEDERFVGELPALRNQ